MISNRFDFLEFSESAKKLNDQDAINLANMEATEAERLLYRNRRRAHGVDEQKISNYTQALKELIWYIRYGFKKKMTDKYTGQILNELYREITKNKEFHPRHSA
jgi:hypothetical protein